MTICCSNPTIPPNYTVCFPSTQVIPNGSTEANPYYDFAAQISYWTYTIEISPAGPALKDLSHWVLQICPDRNLTVQDFRVDISTNGGINFFPISDLEVLTVDPTTGVQNVLKINRGQNKGTTVIYRIAIVDPAFFNLAAGAGTIAIKAGTGSFYFDENTCLHALPTPSVNCDRVMPPTPIELTLTKRCPKHTTIIYTVGDTLSINLEVTNPGNVDVLNVTVLDKINIPVDVIIGDILTDPIATLSPLQVTYTNQDLLITWSGLTIPPGATSLAFQFTILDAPILETVITDIDAGIENLSGTNRYNCIIAVSRFDPMTAVICDLQLCLVINSTRIVDLLLPGYSHEQLRIECVQVEKVYDSCFVFENISRNTKVPFADLPGGSLVSCFPINITCRIVNRTFNSDGSANLTLIFFITLILTDPNNPQITVLRTFGRLKRIVICAPEGTDIDCNKSQILSCICYVV